MDQGLSILAEISSGKFSLIWCNDSSRSGAKPGEETQQSVTCLPLIIQSDREVAGRAVWHEKTIDKGLVAISHRMAASSFQSSRPVPRVNE